MSEIVTNGKSARRRHVRPEQVALNVERVEHLIIEVNASAITQLIDGLERRLAIVEDGMPAIGGLTAQSARLAKLEEAARTNGGLITRLEETVRTNGGVHRIG